MIARARGPRIVCIGGGTGISNMLRGLKRHTDRLTAIVSVADDGGGSGVLRDELDMPPPGDIRNCLEALANTEPTMQALLSYRFTQGRLKGQSFGNLFLAALNGMCPSFDQAVARMSEVLAVTGRVLPVSNDFVRLIAEFSDGSEICGESKIAAYKLKSGASVSRVRLDPADPGALSESIDAIRRADMIVIGPGSLYTSIIPNILIREVSEAVAHSGALKLYVLNIMTQPGETEGYTAGDHVEAIFCHAGLPLFDYCLVSPPPADDVIVCGDGARYTPIDTPALSRLGVKILRAPLANRSGYISRHDPERLAAELMRIFEELAETRVYR